MAGIEREVILRQRVEGLDDLVMLRRREQEIKEQMAALAREARTGQMGMKVYSASHRQLARDLTLTRREMQSLTAAERAQGRAMRELDGGLGVVIKGQSKLSGFINGTTKEARIFSNVTGFLAGNLLRLGTTIGGFLIAGRMLKDMLGGVSRAMNEVVEIGSRFEQDTIRFTALLQNEARAIEQVGMAAEFSFSTPFEMDDVMAAATVLEGFGISSEENLRRAANMAAAFSDTLGSMKDAAIALGKLRLGQFERLEPIGLSRARLAEIMGVQLAEIQKNTPETLKRMWDESLDYIDKKSAGASERLSRSYSGVLSNIRGEWARTNLAIADMGAFDQRKAAAEDQLTIVREIRETWEQIAKTQTGRAVTKGLFRIGGEFQEGGVANTFKLMYVKMLQGLINYVEKEIIPLSVKRGWHAGEIQQNMYQGFPPTPTKAEWEAMQAANNQVVEKTEYQLWLEKQIELEQKKQTEELFKQTRERLRISAILSRPGEQALLASAGALGAIPRRPGAAAPTQRGYAARRRRGGGAAEPQAVTGLMQETGLAMDAWDQWAEDAVATSRQTWGQLSQDAENYMAGMGNLNDLIASGLDNALGMMGKTWELYFNKQLKHGEQWAMAWDAMIRGVGATFVTVLAEMTRAEGKRYAAEAIAAVGRGIMGDVRGFAAAAKFAAASAAFLALSGTLGGAAAAMQSGSQVAGFSGYETAAGGMTTAGGATRRNLLTQKMAAPMTINITINNNFYAPVYAENPGQFFDKEMAPYVEEGARKFGWGFA